MKTDGFIGVLYTVTEWMTRLVLANVLWILFNIPIIFIGLNMIVARSTGEFIFFSALLAISLPFFFFPATMSIFALIRRWVMGEADIKVIPAFWMHYKENYSRGLLGGFIFVIIWVILLIDYYYFVNFVNDLLKYLFYALFLFIGMFTIHFFSNNVHFHTKLFPSLKNALLMTLKNPIISLIVMLMNILIVGISFKLIPFLIPFFMGSFIAIISFITFYKISLRLPTASED